MGFLDCIGWVNQVKIVQIFLKWEKRKFSKFKNLKIGVWMQIGKVWDKRQILPLKKAINKNLSSHPIPIFLIFFSFFLLFSFLYPACATSHSLSPSSSFFPSSPCLPFSLYLAHFDHHQDKHLPLPIYHTRRPDGINGR